MLTKNDTQQIFNVTVLMRNFQILCFTFFVGFYVVLVNRYIDQKDSLSKPEIMGEVVDIIYWNTSSLVLQDESSGIVCRDKNSSLKE